MLTRALHLLPPETAHRMAIWALGHDLVARRPADACPRLATRLCNLALPNPLGLAAGFDKNAEALSGLARMGFGFVEIGTVTPRPQQGNPKPRLFRLPEDRALINRLGFNGEGLDRVRARLARRTRAWGVIGANIGANRDAKDPIEDYVTGLRGVYALVDYVTVNVSSPNTPGLRRLQHGGHLDTLLTALLATCRELEDSQPRRQSGPPPGHPGQAGAAQAGTGRAPTTKPIFLKIAPDLEPEQEAEIAATALAAGIDGLIVANTTLARPHSLKGRHRQQAGGLSGAPLMAPSTALLRRIYRLTGGRLPLIGVGGIASGADAYAKIRAGATAVQLYTALIYQGPDVLRRILDELDALLARDGHTHLAAAVGSDV
jgi:dihydroorotate dehydrogenase